VKRPSANARTFKTRWFERFARKEAARHVLRLTEKQIEELVKNGDFVEVKGEEEISK
jgi:hypothetical protein